MTYKRDKKTGEFDFEKIDSDVFSVIRRTDKPIKTVIIREPIFESGSSFNESIIIKALRSRSPDDWNHEAEDIFTVLGNGVSWHHGQLISIDGFRWRGF